MLNLPQLKTIV
ncbi:hypothetical protein GlitD10_0295, partial [Gloeomargarita lithophora Alchichica-D10]